jgi:hypothetical protein
VEIEYGRRALKPMPRHIQKRRRRYYALLDIPRDIRHAFDGKPRFVKSLQTENLDTAQRRVGFLVGGWQAQIKAARAQLGTGNLIEDDAQWYRKHLPLMTPEDREAIEDNLQEHAEKMEASAPGSGVAFYKRSTGQLVDTLSHLDEWIATLHATNEPKSRSMKRSDVARMAQRFPVLTDVTKREVRRWVTELADPAGDAPIKPATISRILSHCRGYWLYLGQIEMVSDETLPFNAVGGTCQSIPSLGRR